MMIDLRNKAHKKKARRKRREKFFIHDDEN